MSLAQSLSTYLTLNILLGIGFCFLFILAFFARKTRFRLSSSSELRVHYQIITLILFICLIHPFLPENNFFKPTAKVWSAQSIKSFRKDYVDSDKGGYLIISTQEKPLVLSADKIANVWLFISFALLAFGGTFLWKDVRALLRIRKRSYLVRQIGQVKIYANDDIFVPFSYWSVTASVVVVPSAFLVNKNEYKMSLAHEIQHHRQRDTRWIYVFWTLRLICVVNPFIHLWNRWICEIQEFACDETLVDQNKVDSQAYIRCLVEVAQTALQQEQIPVCATGLTFLIEGHLLKRRVEKMLQPVKSNKGRSIGLAFTVASLTLMLSTAYASKNIVQDRRITLPQAEAMAKNASGDAFPVVVNDLVLKELNRYLGTVDGREFIKTSLQRMQGEKSFIDSKLSQYAAPEEFLAIPVVESGYQNLPQSSHSGWGAGYWMFTESTAKNYGLRVDNQKDERLDLNLETDAAMRLLSANKHRFQDWRLSVLAYNIGEKALQGIIDKTGSRDPWVLVRNGANGDDYLQRLMAVILIIKNPDFLD